MPSYTLIPSEPGSPISFTAAVPFGFRMATQDTQFHLPTLSQAVSPL